MQKPNTSRLLSAAVPPFLAASIALLVEQTGVGTTITAVLVVFLTVVLWRLLSRYEKPRRATAGSSAGVTLPPGAEVPGHAVANAEERHRVLATR